MSSIGVTLYYSIFIYPKISFHPRPKRSTGWDVQLNSLIILHTDNDIWGYLLGIRVALSAHFFISVRYVGMMGSGGKCTTFNVFLSDHFVIVFVCEQGDVRRSASSSFLCNGLLLSLFLCLFQESKLFHTNVWYKVKKEYPLLNE